MYLVVEHVQRSRNTFYIKNICINRSYIYRGPFVATAPSTGIMANLEQWVNDRLHDILGLSDRYVSQFMIGTARKASSSQDFVSRLEQTGTIDIDQNVIAFAQELFDKVYTSYSIIIPCYTIAI